VEIVSSTEGSAVRDSGTSSIELALLQPLKPGKLLPQGWVLNGRPLLKRSSNKALLRGESFAEPKAKKAKSTAPTSSKLAKLLQRRLVREKIVKVAHFQE